MGGVDIGGVVAFAVLAGAVAFAMSLVSRAAAGRGRRRVLVPAALDAAIVASLAAVAVATLSPLAELGTDLGRAADVNLAPFEAMRGAPPVYGVINAVLLVPTTVMLAQRWRSAGVVRLTLTAALLSAGIELLQLVHPSRGTNVDDLLLNTAGAAVAALLGVLVRRGPRG